MKKNKYEVLSPDGFSIEMNENYNSIKEAKNALDNFVKRFEVQGYYSTIIQGCRFRIPVNEIKNYCEINQINNN